MGKKQKRGCEAPFCFRGGEGSVGLKSVALLLVAGFLFDDLELDAIDFAAHIGAQRHFAYGYPTHK